ncbi:hypothetical protein BPMI_00815 [Candidatus Burkholderia pumila]|uniref:Uncharacterized protein n=1 Tax=Candidatus Burkholderia pumila TaxID=1090375 RepID=A0ABR5HL53_9BURK|nr:hypothetical protein BPMI_00815 [Candidatus Burkholderia pumila]
MTSAPKVKQKASLHCLALGALAIGTEGLILAGSLPIIGRDLSVSRASRLYKPVTIDMAELKARHLQVTESSAMPAKSGCRDWAPRMCVPTLSPFVKSVRFSLISCLQNLVVGRRSH